MNGLRCLGVQELEVEVDVLEPCRSFVCEEGSAIRRKRQIRHQRDKVVRVRGRPFEALNVAVLASQRNSLAAAAEERSIFSHQSLPVQTKHSLFVFGIVDVVRRAVLLRASIASFDVCANFVAAPAHAFRFALVDVLARATVAGKAVAGRASALVGAVRVLAESHAQIRLLVHLALVDVLAGAIVLAEVEAGLAGAPERAPVVNAALRAEAGDFGALVDVDADFVVVGLPLEALLAVASVGAGGVHALRVSRADLGNQAMVYNSSSLWPRLYLSFQEIAFVDVFTAPLVVQLVAGWACARVSTQPVAANLVRSTLGNAFHALINVCNRNRLA